MALSQVGLERLNTATTDKIGINKNILINGAMQVAQRGTQSTGNTSAGYTTVDRFQLAIAAAGTWTTDQSSVTDLAGFSKAFKVTCTTANGDANNTTNSAGVLACQYRCEGQDLQGFHKGFSSAKQYALSFYVKSNKTGTYNVEVLDNDNSRHICKSYTISSASTWEKKTLILDADTTGKFDNDANLSLQLRWYLGVGTNFTSGTLATSWASNTTANKAVGNVNLAQATSNIWEITGVQLEVGSVATDFEHRSFAQELALCQRYFQRFESAGDSHMLGAAGDGTTTCKVGVPLCVPLRASPTVACGAHRWYRSSSVALTTSTTAPAIINFSTTVDSPVVAIQAGGHTVSNNEAGVWSPHNGNDLTLDCEL